MKLRFYPARPKSESTVVILTLRSGDGGKKVLRLSTGVVVRTKFWETKKDRLKKNSYDSSNINSQLDEIDQEAKRLIDIAIRHLHVDPFEYLKKELPKHELLSALRIVKSVDIEGLIIPAFDAFLTHTKETKAFATYKRYNTNLNHLKAFIHLHPHYSTFQSVSHQFEDDFLKYLYQNKLTDNTVSRTLLSVKTMLLWCQDRKMHSVELGKLFAGNKLIQEATTIALTRDELTTIENLSLEGRLDRVRDAFVFLCNSGLRHSDYLQLKLHHKQDKFLKLTSQKTKQKLKVPVLPKLQEVWDKYSGDLPKITGQKFNEYLKELGQLANLFDEVEDIKHRGKERISKVLKKYELLNSHVGRRTYITLSLEAGMTPDEISDATGHTDYRSFKKYIKHSSDFVYNKSIKAWNKHNEDNNVEA